MGAEEPSKIRGGALLGGRGGPLDNFVGEVTKYVIAKAPCQVILTAPPAGDSRKPSRPCRRPTATAAGGETAGRDVADGGRRDAAGPGSRPGLDNR